MHGNDRALAAHGAVRPGIFIVTPVKLYRDGIAHFLRSSEEVEVLGTGGEGTDTIAVTIALLPDVVLLDMALEDSRATARAIRAAVPSTAIVALAVPESETFIVRCAEAGISAYVPREASLDELLTTVTRAAAGEAVCSPRIAGGLFRRVAALAFLREQPVTAVRTATHLTARETEVIGLIDDGLSNQQIAERLCIEVATVKNHVHSILDKLGASSRSEAAARARKLAWSAP
jgi:two-component system nitrate/nitrite response regulator NarL